MKALTTFVTLSFLIPSLTLAQGYFQDFNDGDISGWENGAYSLSAQDNALKITASGVGASYEAFTYNFPEVLDISVNTKVLLEIKSEQPVEVRIDVIDENGIVSNGNAIVQSVTSSEYQLFTYDFDGRFVQSYPDDADLDPTSIASLLVYFAPGGPNFSGEVFFDDVVIGSPDEAILAIGGSLDFGTVKAGNTKSKEISLQNVGGANLSINSITVPTGFSLESEPTSIAGNATEIINVTFTPTEAIDYSGELTVNYTTGSGDTSIPIIAEGSLEDPPGDLNGKVHVNQLGYYPNFEKLAMVVDGSLGDPFKIRSEDLSEVVFEGTLSESEYWDKSEENLAIADFSDFTESGTFVLDVGTLGRSYPFEINTNYLDAASKASLKAYYYNRASFELEQQYAGQWSRPAGHPDTDVEIHASTATTERPAGSTISSPGGWYDAGDFGKYIVNGGVSVHTLLAAYELFPAYYDELEWNIPESGNNMPDILDEVLYELDWMLTMQDPNDGGVYHKLTTANFVGQVMPHESNVTRYVVQKSTAATLNFAANMAQAARIYEVYDETKAATFLQAANDAWDWAQANPQVYYNQSNMNSTFDPDVSTGEYGDSNVSDEFIWAGAELYISTLDDSYLDNINLNTSLNAPSWPGTAFLGFSSLYNNRQNLTDAVDIENVKTRIVDLADQLMNKRASIAYRISTDQFYWGSNSSVGNEGLVMLYGYIINEDQEYLSGAVSAVDYMLGRNAVGYSFLTGYGDNSVKNIHHRQSEADGIDDPVPGFIAGGVHQNWESTGYCTGIDFGDIPAKAFQDVSCAYAMTEVTINWNAPFVFLSGGLEYLHSQASDAEDNLVTPSGLNAEALSTTDIKLTWNDNTNFEDNYLVERKKDGENEFVQIASLAANSVEYTDTQLEPGTTYSYRVKAENSTTASNYSAIETTTTQALPPPNAPTDFEGTSTETSISLTWTDNADDETGFKLYRSLSESEYSVIAELPENSTSSLDENLSQGTKYYYKLEAYNENGSSEVLLDLSTEYEKPVAPSDLSVVSVSHDAIEISWSDNSDVEESFVLERSDETDGSYETVATLEANSTSYNDENLTEETTYFYRVYALNGDVASDNSGSVSVTTNEIPLSADELIGEMIYPNPVGDQFNLELGQSGKWSHLKIYDVRGELLYQQSIGALDVTKEITVKNLSKGMYFLRLENNQERKFFRFVK